MYEIVYNNEVVGTGLSPGEANQWILDLDKELNDKDVLSFRRAFGFTKGNFEDYLYDSSLIFNIEVDFNGLPLTIKEL